MSGTLRVGYSCHGSAPLPVCGPPYTTCTWDFELSCSVLASRALRSAFCSGWLQKVVKLLVDPKASCVTITGERGSGKTERAIQACDYVRERHHFESVLWADCHDVVEAEAGPPSSPIPPAFSADWPGALDWSGHLDSALDPCRLVSGIEPVCCIRTHQVYMKHIETHAVCKRSSHAVNPIQYYFTKRLPTFVGSCLERANHLRRWCRPLSRELLAVVVVVVS